MEDILRPLYQERASHKDTLGILLIQKVLTNPKLTEDFDAILFVITENDDQKWTVKHYAFENQKAALHIVSKQQLKDWFTYGSNRKAIEWVIRGKSIFDRNEFIENFKEDLRQFPEEDRKKKMGLEFAKLIKRQEEGKSLFHANQYLDSFNHIVHALHHLARLAVIEKGYYPEITVWDQVKKMEPEFYKLYTELVDSKEPLEKRLELMLIASEFSLSAKTKLGSRHILDVMSEKDTPWTYAELTEHVELKEYEVDLVVLLEHLIKKELVFVVEQETKGKGIYHRTYQSKK
jgi:hypothetical protein